MLRLYDFLYHMNPKNKTVIITGASSGIGAATARAFAAAGARIVLAARDAARLDELARTLPGEPLVVPTDMGDRNAVEALVAQTISARGNVDIVVNNAGVGLSAPIAELRTEDLQRAFDVNVFGPLWLTQAALPHMRRQQSGQIINVSSVVGWRALPYAGGYAATKAALDRLNEALRVELRSSGIAVTLVRPGSTSTEFHDRRMGAGQERRRFSPKGVPPERVADAIVRAATTQPRVVYIAWNDRLQVLFGLLAPGLADRALGWAVRWQGDKVTR